MANTEKVRLNKYLSETGCCSRREADRLIEEGRVWVNGKIAQPGMKVNDLDKIMVDGNPVEGRNKKVVLAYYKPVGVVCTERDKHAQVTIRDVFDYPVRVTYAGRLDKDSEGLLLMTNDGDLINGLMRAANFHEKEYLVRVNKPMSRDFLKKMSEGVMLKELKTKTRPCFVKEEGKFVFRIILTQGLNRQIRRMCKAFGYEVASIKRVRVANVMLGDLQPGETRPVTGSELKELYYHVEKSAQRGAARKNGGTKPESGQSVRLESGQNVRPESRQSVRPERGQNVRPERKQNARPENRQSVKPENRQNAKPERGQNTGRQSGRRAYPKTRRQDNHA